MPPISRAATAVLALACALAVAAPAAAVIPTGRLQVTHLDVGQGDGAVLISPQGQVVLIDEGPSGASPVMGMSVVSQLIALGVSHVDYHFASHYHADHIGNIKAIVDAGIPIDIGWDRGGSYSTGQYATYIATLGSKRRTLVKGQTILLDSLSAHPVTIRCVDLAGAGIPTTDENALCVVLKVSYGEYDEVFGGDLQGPGSSVDIETTVGPEVGPVEVYKVHHHGSRYSSGASWLANTQPKIGVISVGNGNGYGHPTSDALARLHNANVHTFWTEQGKGVLPNPAWDCVANGQVIISATWEPGGVDSIRTTAGCATSITNSGPADLTPPTVAVNTPDGGEDWKAGSSHAVTWTATDNLEVSSVDLAYSIDGGATFPYAIATGLANSGSFAWTVPANVTTEARVRATARDAGGNSAVDASDGNFAISTWTIVASAGPGGGITPSGTLAVSEGATANFSITQAVGYQVADVLVDGGSVGPVTSYLFEDVVANHTIEVSFGISSASVAGGLPRELSFRIDGANPASRDARFRLALPAAARVELSVYDISGRRVAQLFDGSLAAGYHSLSWNPRGAGGTHPPGVYLALLRTSGRQMVQRLILLN